jgi:hypothetical protein
MRIFNNVHVNSHNFYVGYFIFLDAKFYIPDYMHFYEDFSYYMRLEEFRKLNIYSFLPYVSLPVHLTGVRNIFPVSDIFIQAT